MRIRGVLPAVMAIGIFLAAEASLPEKGAPSFPPESLNMNLTTLPDLAARIQTMEYVPGDPGLLVYGTGRGFVYLYRVHKDKFKLVAKTNLWKGIKEIALADLNRDGKPEVMVLTKEAMLYALALDDLSVTWSTQENYFERIACFTVADLEQDGIGEIILLADGHLCVFDIGAGYERWKSLVEYEATHMVAGDVDGDNRIELVLSSGIVLDSRLYEEEWIYEQSFGHRMDLFDIDGDGILEVVSLDGAGDLQIVDVDDRARQWQ